MSADPWGTSTDLFSEGTVLVEGGAESGASQRWLRSPAAWLAIAAAVLAIVALGAALDGANGNAAVGVAVAGYLLAVLADVLTRRSQYAQKNYQRPWILVCLRVLTFVLALWVGWEVASSAVGAA